MQETQLYIPKKIKVGYQKREDTYTKKLAYVIYFDDKGVLRKETSWNGWRHKDITPDEYENVPTEGFVLNRGVGGQRESWGWNARNEYIRVYDPRGFEFEISVANLLYILQEATSTKGKGLEGEFIYSWDGKELVLLPVNSGAYKASTEYTKLQSKKVSTKELVAGCVYMTKKQEKLIYLGRFDYYTLVQPVKIKDRYNNEYYDNRVLKASKVHVFLNEKQKDNYYGKYVIASSPSNISVCVNDIPVSNYAELIDEYNSERIHSSKPINLVLEPKKIKVNQTPRWSTDVIQDTEYYIKISETDFKQMSLYPECNWDGNKYTLKLVKLYEGNRIVSLKDNQLTVKSIKPYNRIINTYKPDEVESIEAYDLITELENGKKIKFDKYYN